MIEFSFENISDCVFHHAAQQPDAPALITRAETISYSALAKLVGHATNYLQAQRLKAGDRVGIAMMNSVERVVISLATIRLGATPIELPTDINAPALAAQVSRFRMAATVVETSGPDSPALIALTINLDWRAGLPRYTGDARFQGDPDLLQFIVLSSGSTGIPKGIVATHYQRVQRAMIYVNGLDFYQGAAPRLLLPAPASTSWVSQFLITQLIHGGAVILLPTFRYMNDMVRELAIWEDVVCPLPPALARDCVNYAGSATGFFNNMRALVIGGQPLAGHEKKMLMEQLTPNLHEVYGSAGSGIIAAIAPADILQHPESVGRPITLPGAEVQIVDEHGAALPAGSIGQLRLRGPNVARGFFHPADNQRGTERFIDGWYYPGEVVSLGDDDYLKIEGRMADAIQSGGVTLYPPEIETIISRHPQVAEVAVVGRPGPLGGETIIAFVVGKPGFNPTDINTHCRTKLPDGKKPGYVYYGQSLPHLGNGKIDRQTLKTMPLAPIDPLR